MQPSLTHLAPVRAACLRHRGPYQGIGATFARLEPIAEAAGLFDSPPELIAVYHDNPNTVAPADLRSDAGVVLPDGVPVPPGLDEVLVAPGAYVHARHLGPYDTLPATWARLKDYLLSGEGPRRGSGPGYEVYRNNPVTAAPEDLVTDVYIPTA